MESCQGHGLRLGFYKAAVMSLIEACMSKMVLLFGFGGERESTMGGRISVGLRVLKRCFVCTRKVETSLFLVLGLETARPENHSNWKKLSKT